MKNVYIGLLSFVSLTLAQEAYAENAPQASESAPQVQVSSQSSNFTPAQVEEIKKVVGEVLLQNPDLIMSSFQAGMEKQQKEAVVKMEQAVQDHKDKIFKDEKTPVAGNVKGTQSLVVFLDPGCGYCKKFHGELATLLNQNKDIKIIFKDIPIMGPNSITAIKALLAAKEQGKYDKLQKALFSSEKALTKKEIINLARSAGLDTKKLQADMKKKTIQEAIDQNLELAKVLGINGTPTLIIGETKVVPGYMSAEDLSKALKEASSPSSQEKTKKTS